MERDVYSIKRHYYYCVVKSVDDEDDNDDACDSFFVVVVKRMETTKKNSVFIIIVEEEAFVFHDPSSFDDGTHWNATTPNETTTTNAFTRGLCDQHKRLFRRKKRLC